MQGVGFRYFVEHAAQGIGVRGHVRNLDTGEVEVYAVGSADQLAQLSGLLWKGPRFSDVRGVDEREAPVEKLSEFRISH